MCDTKYGFSVKEEVLISDINRLTNQLWKLIPMRENKEDWVKQLDTVILEIVGLHEVFNLTRGYVILLTKLEGLKAYETSFDVYRSTVFESISLLREMRL